MRLTSKLLDYLNRVFSKDPGRFLALRLSYDGALTWRVADATLTTSVTGGSGQALVVDLTALTVSQLVSYLAAQPGYSVVYMDATELSQLSARVLIDGAGDIAASNGDHLYGYTSVLWAYTEAAASELQAAGDQIEQMLLQMSTRTASDVWLDEIGGYYAVPRIAGEADASYGPRIIAEVLRPRSNNVALEMAIKEFTGQDATVSDVVTYSHGTPAFNGVYSHDGTIHYNTSSAPVYNLFDVVYGYDLLNGGDFSAFDSTMRAVVERLRAAGTHLRSLSLQGSTIADTLDAGPVDTAGTPLSAATLGIADTLDAAPSDASAPLAASLADMQDTVAAGVDALGLAVSSNFTFNAFRTFNGAITYRGVSTTAEDVGSAGDVPFSLLMQPANGAYVADGSMNADGLI